MHGIGAGVKKWQIWGLHQSPHPINMTESFQIFSHATYNLHLPLKFFCQIIPPVHLQYWPCLWIGEGFYKNPFVWDRGLTQPQLGPFLNSKLFLEKHKSNQVKTGQNRSKQTKHEKQVKIKIRVENPPHCSPYYFSHSTLFHSIVE